MIPRVDYTESFLLVMVEVGVHTIIGISLHFINEDIVQNTPTEEYWVLKVYNVEAAFLNAEPGTKMYIQIPDEMVELEFITREEQCEYAIWLESNMHGNVDAALHFFKKYSRILVMHLRFEQSRTDLCIFLSMTSKENLSWSFQHTWMILLLEAVGDKWMHSMLHSPSTLKLRYLAS